MDQCVLCQVLGGVTEGSFVHRGKYCSVFLDVQQINQGHLLIVPNHHYMFFEEIHEKVLNEMFKLSQKLYSALVASKIRCDGANMFFSTGKGTGKQEEHFHMHLVPRYENDKKIHKFLVSEKTRKLERFELDRIALEIKRNLKILE